MLQNLRPSYHPDPYDGVILLNVREFQQDYTVTTYAVFKPTQIKAIDAVSFDGNDPNFRHNGRRKR